MPSKHKQQVINKLHQDVATYLAFYAIVHPDLMLGSMANYPMVERKGAAAIKRVRQYC